jgi:general secretion pathway protein M
MAPLRAWWQTRTPRERQAVRLAATLGGLALLWLLLVAPAWRTLQRAGSERMRLDAQLAEMQALAQEAAQRRAAPPQAPEQASAALNAAMARLGNRAQLLMQGERAVVTLQGLALEELGPWLQELGSGARTRPLELSLTRGAGGYSGTLVLALPTRP